MDSYRVILDNLWAITVISGIVSTSSCSSRGRPSETEPPFATKTAQTLPTND